MSHGPLPRAAHHQAASFSTRRRTRQSFYNLIPEVTSYHFHHILFLRHGSLDLAHIQGKRIWGVHIPGGGDCRGPFWRPCTMACIAGIHCMHHSSTCDGILVQEPVTVLGLSLATGACLVHRWDRPKLLGS